MAPGIGLRAPVDESATVALQWGRDTKRFRQVSEAAASERSAVEIMKRYGIVIEKGASNYAAYVPDLPGCIATGATVEETERLLREAIEMHLQGMKEDGIPIPEPST
jgi:predicted RNase H-like HicB family nuclease